MLVKLQHSVVGLPDRVLLRRGAATMFLEFKRPKGEGPTPIQAYWIDKLRTMHFRVEVVRSVAEFKALLIP